MDEGEAREFERKRMIEESFSEVMEQSRSAGF